MKRSTCPQCGGKLATVNLKGEAWPYRDQPELQVARDFTVLRCTDCGESSLDAAQTEAFDAVLAESYADVRVERQSQLIQSIIRQCELRQSDLEALMGVSAGYLSKAQHQRKVLSPPTFRLLFLLAGDPSGIVRELAKLDPALDPLVRHLDHLPHSPLTV
jgi:hypothetical protein